MLPVIFIFLAMTLLTYLAVSAGASRREKALRKRMENEPSTPLPSDKENKKSESSIFASLDGALRSLSFSKNIPPVCSD